MEQDLIRIIKDLINHSYEEEWFEFKINWYEPYELGEYISALSNSATLLGRKEAYFVWGVEDKGHKIVGTNIDFHQDVKNEPLQHYLARQIAPNIGFRFDEVFLDDKRIVVLTIECQQHLIEIVT